MVLGQLIGWDAAFLEIVASAEVLEELEERTDADGAEMLEVARMIHGQLLNVLAAAGPSCPN
jgi:hypothetical protein